MFVSNLYNHVKKRLFSTFSQSNPEEARENETLEKTESKRRRFDVSFLETNKSEAQPDQSDSQKKRESDLFEETKFDLKQIKESKHFEFNF